MKQWQDRYGVTHIVDTVLGSEEYTWCHSLAAKMFAGKWYKPPTTDLHPTCIVCIANAQRFYSLPNIQALRAR